MNEVNLSGIGMTSQRTRDRLVNRLKESGIESQQVLEAIRNTPRHIFVDEALSHRAYEDTALPIGHNQTVSQPYIVAKMTSILLENGGLNNVLEIGTGSGYQSAVLAHLVKKVYSIERIRVLQDRAKERFRLLGLKNIVAQHSDGSMGWEQHAPYDGIIVTAAPMDIPESLLEQLDINGRLVIPVGDNHSQELILVVRTEDGFERTVIEKVNFVPLLSGA